MKKLLWLLVFGFLAVSCSDETFTSLNEEEIPAAPAERYCASMEVLQEQIKLDPARGKRLEEIEAFIKRASTDPKLRLVEGKIVIPVHVNVLYSNNTENISDAQIQSQIDVLNEDFTATNADYSNVPVDFEGVKTSVGITFELAGTTRKSSTKRSWRTNDDMKKSSKGGINPTDPTTKLNMWVCVLSNSILGYAQFPGGSSATDGVVITTQAFGRGPYNLFSRFNLGRTATHEVGHWLNLRHIWGDATCGNDFVSDTPTHNTSNTGCPTITHRSTCSGTPLEMWMNYMDYTDDRCMYMFSAGQKARIDAAFADAKARNSFAQ